jgi:hypothetical protein
MATETQRNFQKQMKEMSKENKNKEEIYSYVHDDFISSDVKFKRKRIIKFSGLGSFIVLLFMVVPSILNIIGHNSGIVIGTMPGVAEQRLNSPQSIGSSNGTSSLPIQNQNSDILNYIKRLFKVDAQLNIIIRRINRHTEELDMKSYDSRRQFSSVLDQGHDTTQILLNELVSINYKDSNRRLRDLSIKKYQEYLMAMEFYNTGVISSSQQALDKANEHFSAAEEEGKLINSEIINLLKQNGIQYKIENNGAITYWN